VKLLYVVDEHDYGDHIGPREALKILVTQNILDEVLVFPFLVEEKKAGSWNKTLDLLFHNISEFHPELILISHIGKHSFSNGFFKKIKGLYTKPPIIAYDERDVYGLIRKPLPNTVIELAQNADLIALVTTGDFEKRFRNAKCINIIYLPHVANLIQFGHIWTPTEERQFDIVMIGNLALSRMPLLSMPGVLRRKKLAYRFYREFGNRFAVFGKGWGNAPFCKGPIPYENQEAVLRRSWISIGCDHFPDYQNYFSDRLPISLLSGVAHLTYKAPGLENYFTDGYHCVFYTSVNDAVEKARKMLSLSRAKLAKIGAAGAQIAKASFTEEGRMQKLINKMIEIYSAKSDIN
jgi:hypothetical protein